MSSRGKVTSMVWYHFTKEGEKAKCRYCFSLISSSNGSTGNMKRHLQLKHPLVPFDRSEATSTSACAVVAHKINKQVGLDGKDMNSDVKEGSTSDSTNAPNLSLSSASVAQELMTKFVEVNRPISAQKSRLIDIQLLKTICKEYHPYSLVDDPEFREFVRLLCPSYTLPSRKTLTYSLLPTIYNQMFADVKQHLQEASAISLTCDGWTNLNNVGFYAMTAHFIDKQGMLISYLLECSELDCRHTGENIASWITKVLKAFSIETKITALVTDNASNMKSAASVLQIDHVPCFAHSLNLVVQNSIGKSIKPIVDKVKQTVQYFKKSSYAMAKLIDMQKSLNKPQLKLKQDVPTRWNSSYDMLDRFLLNKEPLVSTLALMNSKHTFSADDWSVIENSVKMLKIFNDVTVEVSAEKNVSFSKTCVLNQIMLKKMGSFSDTELPELLISLKNELVQGLQNRFGSRETNEIIAQAILLDPRFKKHAFSDGNAYKMAYNSMIRQMTEINEDEVQVEKETACSIVATSSLWADFDGEVAASQGKQDPSTAATVELDKYLAEPNLSRTSNPLEWWANRRAVYPKIYELMLQRLSIPATSVPCERIFSKAGEISTQKRNRLSAKHIAETLFIGHNMK